MLDFSKQKDFLIANLNIFDIGLSEEKLEELFDNQKIIQKCYEKSLHLSIGAAILVKDQEEKISSAVEDAFLIADEVVVCDTGSTDNTIEVLNAMELPNLRIYNLEWIDNYAFMRNQSMSFLKTNWIFIIDSDERLITEIDKKSLKFCLSFLEWYLKSREISLSFRQASPGTTGIGYPQRLFSNVPNLKFYGYVHEELRSQNLIELRTRFTLFNEGTSEEERKKFGKEERYNKLLLKNISEEPDNIKWVAMLSMSWIMSNLDRSIPMVQKLIIKLQNGEISDDYFEIKLYSIYILLLIFQNQPREDILREINFAKTKFSNNPLFYVCEYFLKIKDIDERVMQLVNDLRQDVSNIKQSNNSEWNIFYPIESLECSLIRLLMRCEKYDLAFNMYKNNPEILKQTGLISKEASLFDNMIH